MLSYHTCPLATLGGKNTGGMNVYVRDLARQLGKMNVQVDVFTRSQDEHVPHVLHDLGYGNRVVHIPAGPEYPLPKPELVEHIPTFVQGVLQFAKSKNIQYDVIHSHYWMSGVAAQTLSQAWDAPIVHMFHTLGIMKNRIAGVGEAEGNYRIQGERSVIRSADCIIAATIAELAQLQWLYQANARRVTVIPPGVDVSRFYPIPKDEAKEFIEVSPNDRIILFVGRIEPLKGLDILLHALKIMKSNGVTTREHLCVAIIGGDPEAGPDVLTVEMNRLQELRIEYHMEELVTFLGKRDQDTLPYYYSAAEAVIMPSQYESFGMVALEAMACGTPVVASQVGGLAFLVMDGKTGFQVPSSDAQALADCLTTLLGDRQLRQKMGVQAAEYAQSYRWETIAQQIVEVYQNVSNSSVS